VIRVDHRHFDVTDRLRSPLVHGRNLFGALFRQPKRKLVDPHHNRVVAFDDFDRVADVVAVSVRAQQDVNLLYFLVGLGAHGIAHDPGIDEDRLPARSLNTKSRVAQPREFDAFQIHACSIHLQRSFK
jgi:hypothetical protein